MTGCFAASTLAGIGAGRWARTSRRQCPAPDGLAHQLAPPARRFALSDASAWSSDSRREVLRSHGKRHQS